MNVAQTIAQSLKHVGIERIYGLPGGEMLDMLEACRAVGIHFVLTHHEASAALMAATEGQFRRAPAACIATLGPGATNLVTGIAHAYLDRSPVIALTADLSTALGPDYTHQRLDLPQLFQTITKASYALTAERAGETMAEALALAGTEPLGPVSVHVPRDLNAQPAGHGTKQNSRAALLGGDMSLEQVAARLNQAVNPLVLIGLGTPLAAGGALLKFINAYGAPFGDTPKIKGILDEAHPLFSGTYGGMMAESVLADFVRSRDLVLAIGLEQSELDRYWLDEKSFVWMLGAPNVSLERLPPHTWLGDLTQGLDELIGQLDPKPFDGERVALDTLSAVREKLLRGVPQDLRGLSPLSVIDTLVETWNPAHCVCCDVGAHKLLIGQAWISSVPNRFFMSNGLSTMGFGIAAPIALSLTNDHAPVLGVIGDGGLLMYTGELETAVREKAHVLYVVLVDSSYSLIETSQRRRELPLYGMRFEPPNLHYIGAAFNVPTWHAGTLDELKKVVGEFSQLKGPALVSVPIDPREYDVQAA